MHDIKEIRLDADGFDRAMQRRGEKGVARDILKIDDMKRKLTADLDDMRRRRNSVSREIGTRRGKGEDTSSLEEEMREVGRSLKNGEDKERELDASLREALLALPNIPSESTPDGLSAENNIVEREVGSDPVFDFEPLDHLEIGNRLGILDFQRGGKIAGAGFPVWCGAGARLERALLNFMLDVQTGEHGYQEMMTPFVANRESMLSSGQIPKLEDDMYHCERGDVFLIPTSEVTLINLHRDEILNESQLPLKYTAYSPCFRREAGAYGHMTRGFLRVHQFNKVEMVCFVRPEDSEKTWYEMISHAEEILKRLELRYRVVRLCAGDMGFNAAACCDLEVWAPADGGKWLEVSSVSNCGSFQARRAGIRYKPNHGAKVRFPHILNGSGLATSRLMVALLETFQTEEGSLAIPPVLRPYMDDCTVITAGGGRKC